MPNPLVNQGTVNRLRASVQWSDFPALNVSAPYLGKPGIRLTFQGQSTLFINTMTGAVTSPEPYLQVSMVMNLLMTQPLAAAYKRQMEQLAQLGDCVVRPASSTLTPYQLFNCAIENVPELDFSGESAAYPVTIGGYYNVNSQLFDVG